MGNACDLLRRTFYVIKCGEVGQRMHPGCQSLPSSLVDHRSIKVICELENRRGEVQLVQLAFQQRQNKDLGNRTRALVQGEP
jgi:hypothetical protein